MDNKHISNTTEQNVVSHATIDYDYSEKVFETIMTKFKAENDSHFHDESSDSEDTSIVYPSSSPLTALPIILYENNSSNDNTTKSNGNKNIVRASPLKLKRTLKINPYFRKREKSSRKSCIKNVSSDKHISDSAGLSDSIILSDSESLSDSIILSDSGSLSDSEITVRNTNNLLDSEMFSDTDTEEIFPACEIKETDFLIIGPDDDLSLDSNCEFKKKPDREIEKSCKFVSDSEKSLEGKIILNSENILNSVKDSNFEMVSDAETKSDTNEQSYINTSVTKEEFNYNKLSTFKIVSNVQNTLDHEILLDGDKVLEIASWSEKRMINYKIISDDEIKPSGYKGLTCIIISDNDDEFRNKEFSTYKINVKKGSNSDVILDGEKVKIVSKTENREVKYEIEPFDNKKSNKCIIIFDDENEFINKNLSTFKIVSNVKKESDYEMLDGDKVYEIDIESQNEKIKYIILSKDEIESSANLRSSIMLSNNKNKFNNKKSTFKIVVKNFQKTLNPFLSQSENEEKQYFKKVSDIKIILNDSLGLKTLDDNNTINNDSQLQIKHSLNSFPCLELTVNQNGDAKQKEYFKEFYNIIRDYIANTQNQYLKQLYNQIGNDEDMLLYLMETFRMFYNGELVVSETADEFSKEYLKDQKTALFNCFGDPKHNINASKPFIHPSSHLHRYSKRLCSNVEPLKIKEITDTKSTSTRSNTIASPKNNVASNKCVKSKFNNIRTSKLLPLCNTVKPKINRFLSDDNLKLAHLSVTKTYNFQLPIAIKRKTQQK
ncbi:uncharacterized protein LOC107883966 [Acyrthosiphon pisum]|uniref:Uncharacterized protein n=1 Tax=Acyrthosiphon pisum TaxID=7029 RepID=A0A8R2H666_ACYPI|nr:uncharacterized protein LOC107883966 [Acyrthosiphon pisum]|eukprot:XP_016660597.1 PREDICTED: uncharacterized protein LOC107883966 [Acyrthosiphon pisum]